MARRYSAKPAPDTSLTEGALAAMGADELRSLIRDLIPWLDESTHARLVNGLVDRAARNRSEWAPAGPTDQAVTEIVAFAEAARQVGYAEPSDVDDYLRKGSNAFLGKHYRTTIQIFRALLIPIGGVDIDLGQHEMPDEVLGVDLADCVAQYVVSMYMTAAPHSRGEAVLSTIDEMRDIGHFWEPLHELERVAIEPLPEFDAFLVQWRTLLLERTANERNSDGNSDEDRWLREVVAWMEGPDGLARLAQTTKRVDDVRAWCRALVDAEDWKAALVAYEDSVQIVTDKAGARADFLDGAALSAQQLGRRDLPERLERAWREAPNMVRLRRWLASAETKRALRQRAAEALSACPNQARRQRVLLYVLEGDFKAAATLLANAPGLGWSSDDHPGHLLFPLLCSLFGGSELPTEEILAFDELDSMSERDEPRLDTPEVGALLERAGVDAPSDTETCAIVLKAMRKAAEKRIDGVTAHKRRRHYRHAASLALACVELDSSPTAARWLSAIREKHRRYPALQRELGHRGGRR